MCKSVAKVTLCDVITPVLCSAVWFICHVIPAWFVVSFRCSQHGSVTNVYNSAMPVRDLRGDIFSDEVHIVVFVPFIFFNAKNFRSVFSISFSL